MDTAKKTRKPPARDEYNYIQELIHSGDLVGLLNLLIDLKDFITDYGYDLTTNTVEFKIDKLKLKLG